MTEEPTGREQIARVRDLTGALDRGDVDTVVSFFASEAVFEAMVGRFEGGAAIRGFIADWLANYEEFAATLEEVQDLGHGVTFAVVRQQGRLVGSTGDVQLRHAAVYVWLDGVIVRGISGPAIDAVRAAAERLAEELEAGDVRGMDVARRSFEAWQNDDFETWIALQDTDVEYLGAVERRLGPGVYHGQEGAGELWRQWRSEVDGFWIESEELRVLADGRILHLGKMGFRGSASGIKVDSQLALVITVRDGRIIRSMDFMSHREALQAVGLKT